MSVEIMKAATVAAHDRLAQGMRWGAYHTTPVMALKPLQEGESGCFAGAASSLECLGNTGWLFACFQGDGVELGIDELVSIEKYNEKVKACTRPWNKFEGTERSLRWVQYLMSPRSPWSALHPFIVEKDVNWINNAGFVFDVAGMPKKLWYNFLMAIRYPWEQYAAYSTFLHLCDAGIEHNLSCFVSSLFYLYPGPETDFHKGPWQIQYPMSFLEGLTLEAAGRFILSAPDHISGSTSPNCAPLWTCEHDKERCFDLSMSVCNKNMSLQEVLDLVSSCVETQKEHI